MKERKKGRARSGFCSVLSSPSCWRPRHRLDCALGSHWATFSFSAGAHCSRVRSSTRLRPLKTDSPSPPQPSPHAMKPSALSALLVFLFATFAAAWSKEGTATHSSMQQGCCLQNIALRPGNLQALHYQRPLANTRLQTTRYSACAMKSLCTAAKMSLSTICSA